jgi:hypothetical protein
MNKKSLKKNIKRMLLTDKKQKDSFEKSTQKKKEKQNIKAENKKLKKHKEQIKKVIKNKVEKEISTPKKSSQEILNKNTKDFSFEFIKKPPKGPKYFFKSEIPEGYNDTYLRALPRDPFWIFAYWEISPATFELMRRHVGDEYEKSKWILRLLDVTDIYFDGTNAWRIQNIDLAPGAVSWYLKVWEPNRTYMLQYGILTSDGRFFSAVNSNAVQMPPYGVSSNTDQEWMTANTNELIRLSGIKKSIGASESIHWVISSRIDQSRSGSGLIL